MVTPIVKVEVPTLINLPWIIPQNTSRSEADPDNPLQVYPEASLLALPRTCQADNHN